MDRGKLAREYFMKGYNCSQAIVLAFSDRMGLDAHTAAKLASSFGGGFGRMREVCGTFSGMSLVLGMLYGYDAANETETANKKFHYARVQELAARFRAEFGSIVCRELLAGKAKEELKNGANADGEQVAAMLSDSAVPTPRTEAYYKKRPCPDIVETGARMLEAYMAELD
ncbi:MAG: C_GCAxxG_C_C family protein [Clostridia bacterium]|nr:C_GCAxxG_C_C family protein [Clostridia bacterium]